MTWIVKATGGYEYNCHPDGEVYGPNLSDAWRYKFRAEAAGVAKRLNRDMKDGLPYRVVRLRRRYVHLSRAAAKALRAAVMGDRFETKDMNEAIAAIDAADLT